MARRDFVKKIRRSFARVVIVFVFWLAGHAPYGLVKAVMRGIVGVGFYSFFGKQRRIGEGNLDRVYGQAMSRAQKRVLLKASFFHFGLVLADAFCSVRKGYSLEEKFRIDGEEHVRSALARGHGAMMVTGHFGFFPHLMVRFAQSGYPVHVIMRRPRDEKLAELCTDWMRRLGVEPIFSAPPRQCVSRAIAALRANGLVFVLLDHHFGAEGHVMVDFLGMPAATGASPVVFAHRTGAAVLPVFSLPPEGDVHRIAVEPDVGFSEWGHDDSGLVDDVQRVTRVIERYVRAHPETWMWMHDRWKNHHS